MANTREWPAGILCVSFWGLDDAYAVRRPTTYQARWNIGTSFWMIDSN